MHFANWVTCCFTKGKAVKILTSYNFTSRFFFCIRTSAAPSTAAANWITFIMLLEYFANFLSLAFNTFSYTDFHAKPSQASPSSTKLNSSIVESVLASRSLARFKTPSALHLPLPVLAAAATATTKKKTRTRDQQVCPQCVAPAQTLRKRKRQTGHGEAHARQQQQQWRGKWKTCEEEEAEKIKNEKY